MVGPKARPSPPAGQAGPAPAERSGRRSEVELATPFGGRAGLLVPFVLMSFWDDYLAEQINRQFPEGTLK